MPSNSRQNRYFGVLWQSIIHFTLFTILWKWTVVPPNLLSKCRVHFHPIPVVTLFFDHVSNSMLSWSVIFTDVNLVSLPFVVISFYQSAFFVKKIGVHNNKAMWVSWSYAHICLITELPSSSVGFVVTLWWSSSVKGIIETEGRGGNREIESQWSDISSLRSLTLAVILIDSATAEPGY